MAEETKPEIAETDSDRVNSATEDMELETLESAPNPKEENNTTNSETNGVAKRAREDGEEENDDVSKKQKGEKSVEEERLESGQVSLGPKSFGSAVEMFDYFFKFLHSWPPNLNVNKYEHMVLLDLLKKGHAEPDKKIGGGINAFQVRYHPMWKSRCFFLVRDDESVDDFSFRKCVDHILPLPEDMKVKHNVNKALGGGSGRGRGKAGGRGGRGGWRGRGRGGKSRH